MLVKGKVEETAGMKPDVNTSKPHSRGPNILNITQKGQTSRLIYAEEDLNSMPILYCLLSIHIAWSL